LYGGIHCTMDLDAGDAIAAQVAEKALRLGPAPAR
jgi:hypothetical protein